ncbi:ATP-binding protein [Cytophagaceae bacterium DM2B3-1]|uniref:histidine kinase n=1 Tax=Xanthocytophaga flava TaxID=3048013 RepID=A0ABT7CEZ4_9BACT|nr:ATP-binding protein [Xanthocytophaga flavus]MDJ1472300.1 ATP-binding protein [Xanthocytophaga flavus]MDJ1492311.1 ATP-binding protein [Xanthocytophaga flavus]
MHLSSIIPGPRLDSEILTEDTFQRIIGLSSVIIHIHEISDLKIIFINKEINDLLGYSLADLEEMNRSLPGLSDKLFPEGFTGVDNGLPEVWLKESTVKHKDGGVRYLKTRYTVLKKGEKQVTGILGYSEDITEEKILLEQLRQQELIMTQAEVAMKFGSWEWDISTNKIVWSKGLWEIFGQDSQLFELNYDSFLSLIDFRDQKRMNDCIAKCTQDHVPYEIEHRIIRPDGEQRILLGKGQTILDETGNTIKLRGSAADITEIRNTTRQLINSEALLKEAESIMGYGSWELCLDTGKMSWSKGMFQLHEVVENAFQAISFDEYLYHFIKKEYRDIVKNASLEAIANQQTFHIEAQLITSKKQSRIVIIHGRLGEDGSEYPRRMVGSINDITQLRKYEEELESKIQELNHSNQELEQFAYVASHDLQEPLRKIRAFAEFLQQRLGSKLTESEFDSLERMRESAKRMQEMIHTLLEFSRIGRSQQTFIELDLSQTLQKVLEDLEEMINERQAIIQIGNLPKVMGVSTQMHQLFLNLIGNALKFNTHQPVIVVSSSLNQEIDTKKYWQISVSDNGIGFDAEYAEQIFILFRRLNARFEYSGTGIGLSICKRIVEGHGGTIWAESVPGNGATFTFTLPFSE